MRNLDIDCLLATSRGEHAPYESNCCHDSHSLRLMTLAHFYAEHGIPASALRYKATEAGVLKELRNTAQDASDMYDGLGIYCPFNEARLTKKDAVEIRSIFVRGGKEPSHVACEIVLGFTIELVAADFQPVVDFSRVAQFSQTNSFRWRRDPAACTADQAENAPGRCTVQVPTVIMTFGSSDYYAPSERCNMAVTSAVAYLASFGITNQSVFGIYPDQTRTGWQMVEASMYRSRVSNCTSPLVS